MANLDSVLQRLIEFAFGFIWLLEIGRFEFRVWSFSVADRYNVLWFWSVIVVLLGGSVSKLSCLFES